MCAIAGVWTAAGAVRVDVTASNRPAQGAPFVERVNDMLDTQRHRGPHPNSIWTDEGLTLGHRRLAILDLSEAGSQPMHSRDGRWTIAFNGEIFNYRELRERVGGVFRTATDTEVLLEACAAWGVEATLARSSGMFGFALWDRLRRELTLARDRFGEKPLVYFWDGSTLAFASELKALAGFHERRLDPLAVDAYLALGYVPAPLAIFKDCRKLPAGHLIRFRTLENAAGTKPCPDPQSQRWWFPDRAPEQRDIPRPRLIEDLRRRVGEAVGLRLRADVPVALSLSGGVDSSVIAAECVRHGARPEAFTVRFDGDGIDLPFACRVASHLGLPHTVVDASAADLAARLDQILFHYDEPFADSSALACFALAEAVGRRYRVVLDGDGGDEAFGGYRHYEYIGVKQTLKAAAAAVGFCDGAGEGRTGVYVQSKSVFRAAERERLLMAGPRDGTGAPEDRCEAGPRSTREAAPRDRAGGASKWTREVEFPDSAGGFLQHALRTDRDLALANGLTYKMDIALGAFGVEGRAPLLDHDVLSWAQALPARELVRGRDKKVLLRAAYAGELPPEVLSRAKHGFGAPVKRWLEGPLRKLAAAVVPCPWLEDSAQRGASGQRLWTLMMFSAWAHRSSARW
ncbi:MAG TPA: asparagine synthase (glutamine-hydrolyzing) [Bryobacteraceae bacterium]|nr:asparagine synthase (glutamine-hydrolyzing) [Bryobacteraceae bacterium]